MLDRISRVFCSILIEPIEYLSVVVKAVSDFFEVVAVQLEEGEEMFVEANSLVVVAIEQTFAMEPRLIDQARQMNIAAELFVRTARSQLLHEAIYVAGRGCARLT